MHRFRKSYLIELGGGGIDASETEWALFFILLKFANSSFVGKSSSDFYGSDGSNEPTGDPFCAYPVGSSRPS